MGGWLSKTPSDVAPPHHRSLRSGAPALVRFHNATTRDVRIYWLDYAGIRREYTLLEPGASHTQPTFLTHAWTFESLGRLRLRRRGGIIEFLYVPLFDQATREAVVYPAELARTVTVVEAPPVAWGPATHAENYGTEWTRAVRAAMLCHARQRKAREAGLLAGFALGDLPLVRR